MKSLPLDKFGRLVPGAHVQVGPTKLDGEPHPHAGKTGVIRKLRGCAAAVVRLDPGIKPQGFICVSLVYLRLAPLSSRPKTGIEWDTYARQLEERARLHCLSWQYCRPTLRETLSYIASYRDVQAYFKDERGFIQAKRAAQRSRWRRLRAWLLGLHLKRIFIQF
jgi:hypothetical protein